MVPFLPGRFEKSCCMMGFVHQSLCPASRPSIESYGNHAAGITRGAQVSLWRKRGASSWWKRNQMPGLRSLLTKRCSHSWSGISFRFNSDFFNVCVNFSFVWFPKYSHWITNLREDHLHHHHNHRPPQSVERSVNVKRKHLCWLSMKKRETDIINH